MYTSISERHPEAEVIVPPRATAVPSQTAERAPTQRDRHLQHIAEKGRMAWQTASGYPNRARAEAARPTMSMPSSTARLCVPISMRPGPQKLGDDQAIGRSKGWTSEGGVPHA